jgi:hypothetical protein
MGPPVGSLIETRCALRPGFVVSGPEFPVKKTFFLLWKSALTLGCGRVVGCAAAK